MKIIEQIPCKICRHRINEDENYVWCNYIQIYGINDETPLISQESKIKNGLEIVPKSIFKDSTCAAQN